jgi:hypothetical protein
LPPPKAFLIREKRSLALVVLPVPGLVGEFGTGDGDCG